MSYNYIVLVNKNDISGSECANYVEEILLDEGFIVPDGYFASGKCDHFKIEKIESFTNNKIDKIIKKYVDDEFCFIIDRQIDSTGDMVDFKYNYNYSYKDMKWWLVIITYHL